MYFERYLQKFPFCYRVCEKNKLGAGTTQEVVSALDNFKRYADYFLSKLIDFVKTYDEHFATDMFYISDHGEPLGENGLYLHNMPWVLAAKSQTGGTSTTWAGKN